MAAALATAPARARSDRVLLTRLALENFRNYAAAELAPSPGLTIVAGANAAGKTNLLEAVFAAITGRSHRAAADHEMVRHGAPFGRALLELGRGTAAGGATVELLLPGEAPPIGLRKRLTVNGVPRRAATLGETVRAVLFRPEEMLLLIGPPGERRRFLDSILAQRERGAARDLADLARILAQRNALLRAIRAEEAPLDALAFWDEQLALVGARVMAGRLAVLRRLGELIGPLHDAVAPAGERRGGTVRLSYLDSLKDAWPERSAALERDPQPTELADALRVRLVAVRQKEAWNGVSLVGPQRDDVRIELGGRDVALHASRGQQRTIILALKLAETDLLSEDGPHPLVLLDDVFSELDRERADRLAALLSGRGQVLVTTADPTTVAGAKGSNAPMWRIESGRLLPPEGA